MTGIPWALLGALLIAGLMAFGGFLWARFVTEHRLVWGLLRGLALCLSVGLYLGVPRGRAAVGALGGAAIAAFLPGFLALGLRKKARRPGRIAAAAGCLLLAASLRAQDGARLVTGDFNGDGKADAMAWRESGRAWDVYLSCGIGFAAPVEWSGMEGSDEPLYTGDLNGDGKTDLIAWRPSIRNWSVHLSTGEAFDSQKWTGRWGSDGPISTGDLDGDGKTDVFMWRGASNTWSVNLSTGREFERHSWPGMPGSDGPISAGDLNGDGKADAFTWSAADNTWSVNLSNGDGFEQQSWPGTGGSDSPISTGDLNGDGRTDVFMWNAATSTWSVNLSTGRGFKVEAWTGAPASDGARQTGDLNGDGNTDVFTGRPADGAWSVSLSNGAGFASETWFSKATPVPAVNWIMADKPAIASPEEAVIVSYSVTVPEGCRLEGSRSAFALDGRLIDGPVTFQPDSGTGSLSLSGYTPPLELRFSFRCDANTSCDEEPKAESAPTVTIEASHMRNRVRRNSPHVQKT
jgi:hypothetical protein